MVPVKHDHVWHRCLAWPCMHSIDVAKRLALNITMSLDHCAHVHADCHGLLFLQCMMLDWQRSSTPSKLVFIYWCALTFRETICITCMHLLWCSAELYINCIVVYNFTIVWQGGISPLMLASRDGYVQVVVELLQHGARVDMQKKVCILLVQYLPSHMYAQGYALSEFSSL